MNGTNKWAVALAVALAAIAGSASANAGRCDAAAITCFASGAAAPAGSASFLDLVQAGEERATDLAAAREALAQPAAFSPQPSDTASTMAPAGVGALDSAMGTEIASHGVPAWLALPRSLAAPDASIAWIFAIGFLGYVILRRVRSTPDY